MYGTFNYLVHTYILKYTHVYVPSSSLIILLIFILQFYPFGLAQNDTSLPKHLSLGEGSSPVIHLAENVLFYDENFTTAYVS